MMNKALVTLAICNFNRASYLRRAIQSCLSQLVNRRHIEVIVVDDGSTDASRKVIKEFESEICFIQHETNLGVGAASQTALQNTNGKYFIRVDSDDYISSELVSTYAPILDNNEDIDFVYGDLLRIDDRTGLQKRLRLNDTSDLKQHGAGILFRTQTLYNAGGYSASLRNSEDYDIITRLLSAGCRGFHYPAPLYRYYKSENNLSEQKEIRRKIEDQIDGI